MLIKDNGKDMDIDNLICQILGTDRTHETAQVSYLTSAVLVVVKPTILCEFGATTYVWNSMLDTDF